MENSRFIEKIHFESFKVNDRKLDDRKAQLRIQSLSSVKIILGNILKHWENKCLDQKPTYSILLFNHLLAMHFFLGGVASHLESPNQLMHV